MVKKNIVTKDGQVNVEKVCKDIDADRHKQQQLEKLRQASKVYDVVDAKDEEIWFWNQAWAAGNPTGEPALDGSSRPV